MPAYIIAHVEVTNPEQYREYTQRTPEAIARYGGKFMVRGGRAITLEGPEDKRRIVVIEFPTLEQAEIFYRSPEYSAARQIRSGAAIASFIAVEGV